jgi:XTP/dITP diphosphohydrolase
MVVEPRGTHGFGFDPIVVPGGQNRTMAEMSLEEKNKFSHRSQAFTKVLAQIQKFQ